MVEVAEGKNWEHFGLGYLDFSVRGHPDGSILFSQLF